MIIKPKWVCILLPTVLYRWETLQLDNKHNALRPKFTSVLCLNVNASIFSFVSGVMCDLTWPMWRRSLERVCVQHCNATSTSVWLWGSLQPCTVIIIIHNKNTRSPRPKPFLAESHPSRRKQWQKVVGGADLHRWTAAVVVLLVFPCPVAHRWERFALVLSGCGCGARCRWSWSCWCWCLSWALICAATRASLTARNTAPTCLRTR